MKKQNKGITLIALIITVIVMLILAGVAISALTGGGLFERVKGAVDVYNKSVQEQDDAVKEALNMLNNYIIGGNNGGDNTYTPDPPDISEITEQPEPGGAISTSNMGVIEIVWLDMNNNIIKNPLPPNVTTDMTPLIADSNNLRDATSAEITNNSWYEYQAQSGATDGKSSNWANVKLTDGSYFVWIPRYAYKIIYFDSEANANAYRTTPTSNPTGLRGTSTIYGMVDTGGKVVNNTTPNIDLADRVKTPGYTDYIPHPAFLGEGYENLGGGFGTTSKGISGFWVAKFEASNESGKPVSKPGVASWVSINIANCYNNALNYDTTKESHLMKNSEWGAVAYLTHSRYGRNGSEVTINNYYVGSTIKTGYAGGSVSASQDTTGINSYAYNTANGQLASTTGNITGIYDLSGGVWEYVAAFNKASSSNISNGSSFASTGGSSTKYATAYSNSTSTWNATTFGDFYSNSKDVSHTGDGIHEVWVSGSTGWFSDYSFFVNSGGPFFGRGGIYDGGANAGVFSASSVNGSAASDIISFRVGLVPQ